MKQTFLALKKVNIIYNVSQVIFADAFNLLDSVHINTVYQIVVLKNATNLVKSKPKITGFL